MDAWVDKRVTGFKLNWFIQDINGIQLTEKLPAKLEDWKSMEVRPGYGTDDLLKKSVQLANKWLMQNMTQEHMISKIVQAKTKIEVNGLGIQIGYLNNSFCTSGQRYVRHETLNNILDKLLGNETDFQDTTNKSTEMGFFIYSAIVFCSNTPKQLYKFFFDLVSKEAPRSILLALVNTIRSSSVEHYHDKLLLNQFYASLEKVLKLEYGNILQVISPSEDLESMKDKSWRFVKKTEEDITCSHNASCQTGAERENNLSKSDIFTKYFE